MDAEALAEALWAVSALTGGFTNSASLTAALKAGLCPPLLSMLTHPTVGHSIIQPYTLHPKP
jgi:hypothetical protein